MRKFTVVLIGMALFGTMSVQPAMGNETLEGPLGETRLINCPQNFLWQPALVEYKSEKPPFVNLLILENGIRCKSKAADHIAKYNSVWKKVKRCSKVNVKVMNDNEIQNLENLHGHISRSIGKSLDPELLERIQKAIEICGYKKKEKSFFNW